MVLLTPVLFHLRFRSWLLDLIRWRWEGMEDVGWKWLINGGWELNNVMYHLEWENRDRREIQENEIIPKCFLGPEVRFFLFSWACFADLFFGEGLDSGENFIRTTGGVEWRDRGYRFSKLSRNMHVRDLAIRLFVESTGLLKNSMICQGTYFIFSLLFLCRLTYLYSLFLAEMLKYPYLLFNDINSFKLDEWVCNTELLLHHDVLNVNYS